MGTGAKEGDAVKTIMCAMALVWAAAWPYPAAAGGQEIASGTFLNAQGKPVGTVSLIRQRGTTLLLLNLRGLPPGVHGIHIHNSGRCDPPGFDSAGPHFNPAGHQHGSANPLGPHAGDLPNITIPAGGTLDTEFDLGDPTCPACGGGKAATGGTPKAASEKGGIDKWLDGGALFDGDGAAVVIHANPDDYTTDPSGNSGPRIACAVLSPAPAGK